MRTLSISHQLKTAPRILALGILMLIFSSCNLPDQSTDPGLSGTGSLPLAATPTRTPFLPPTRNPNQPILSPTPDDPRLLPTLRVIPEEHVVQPGETLGQIAQMYGVSMEALIQANQIYNPNLLTVGQVLIIPAPSLTAPGLNFKIIPDSELVNGPVNAYFDLADFIQSHNGYLATYHEEVDGQYVNGIDIVTRIAREYSVNPRLLLAVLEYQSGWLTQANPDPATLTYPIRLYDDWRTGLYRQLAWAADNLNRGYYLWQVNALGSWTLQDGSLIVIDNTINAGTAGVQHLFSTLHGEPEWQVAVSNRGVFSTYWHLFGYPFDWSLDPLVPADLEQPTLQLPFEPGVNWVFTGGAHGGWGDGSAWAALDFAPTDNLIGCYPSDQWIVAAADGLIVHADKGAVYQDLDDDGLEQTGWTLLYMHVESRDRVLPGTYLKAGDHIGHPSCEGGIATGTHLHIARRYNGEWISADGGLPLVMDGWISVGWGALYDGFLLRQNQTLTACLCREPGNTIQR